eukprot:TRINITY_DN77421_c0_g1_i1.p1 TRINITY_DN77421_c0_g1~~TRINITY_DN77421_c0_g1_i1.p1  ORF type:complete len:151 (+),score=52.17 TRINITY_DN77421_c0_g1_i1:77-529(+)
MVKVKRSINKAKKAKKKAQLKAGNVSGSGDADVEMGGPKALKRLAPKGSSGKAENGAPAARETHHDMKKRHTHELKAVKAEVALLKKKRCKQPKKGGSNKEEKKAISKEIRKMLTDVRIRQEEELKAAGFEVPAGGHSTGAEGSDEGMSA